VDARGPVELATVGEVEAREGALAREAELRVVGSGSAVLRWPVEVDGERVRAAWRVPVLTRPGGAERAAIRVSTSHADRTGTSP
jgi:hypothetical protein